MTRELLQHIINAWDSSPLPKARDGMMQECMEKLRAALAVGDGVSPGEPVAWRWQTSQVFPDWSFTDNPARAQGMRDCGLDVRPLYAHAIPLGFVLVPVVPTEAMHVAAVKAIQRCTGNDDFPPRVYRAMIEAAPKVTP